MKIYIDAKMACMKIVFQTVLLALPLVTGQESDADWNSPNVSACFNAEHAVINFVNKESDKDFLLVSWYRKVQSTNQQEINIAELNDKDEFTVLDQTLKARLNRTGKFGLVLSSLTTGDTGEYSVKLRTRGGEVTTGIGMLKIRDPCIKVEEEVDKCKKAICESSQTNPMYEWTDPNGNKTSGASVKLCAGEGGSYQCCLTSSNSCDRVEISIPDPQGTTDENLGAIIGGVVAGVVAIIVAIIVAVVLIRKKKSEKSDYHEAATMEKV